MEKNKNKELRKSVLPIEPEENNPDCALIALRCPLGNTFKRRFLKTDKIQVLYDYVSSIEEKIFEESDEFDIIQQFPYKIFDDMEKTIEEEKLFPNAMLQILEKDI